MDLFYLVYKKDKKKRFPRQAREWHSKKKHGNDKKKYRFTIVWTKVKRYSARKNWRFAIYYIGNLSLKIPINSLVSIAASKSVMSPFSL